MEKLFKKIIESKLFFWNWEVVLVSRSNFNPNMNYTVWKYKPTGETYKEYNK